MMIPCPYVIFFNKQMVSDFGLDNPYQLVYDGKWTIDAFDKMARAASSPPSPMSTETARWI